LGHATSERRRVPPRCADRKKPRRYCRACRTRRLRIITAHGAGDLRNAGADNDETLTMRARFDAEGDVIVVTGGANGIGLALARAAAQAGARVVVCDVDEAAMAALSGVAKLSTRRLDVSDGAAVFEVLGEVERHFGKIDGLVCAAAIQPRLPVHEMEPTAWDRVLRINLDGVVWCYQAVVSGMIPGRRLMPPAKRR